MRSPHFTRDLSPFDEGIEAGMDPRLAYRRNTQSGWTRIEMLLAIYDGVIDSIDSGIAAMREGRTQDYPTAQLRAIERCLLLISGIDTDASSTAVQIYQLCVFCLGQLKTMEIAPWEDARRIISTLREGFQAIREEGNQLEASGAITSLPQMTEQTLLHV